MTTEHAWAAALDRVCQERDEARKEANRPLIQLMEAGKKLKAAEEMAEAFEKAIRWLQLYGANTDVEITALQKWKDLNNG